jgi:predicted ATPase/DNA-binding SARP family transcriptional activator
MRLNAVGIQVQLLGSCKAVTSLGERVFINDKRHQLLAYLAWTNDWVSRDALADLFWSEGTALAKQNLRGLLQRVQTLGWPEGLEIERTRLRWKVETDVRGFQKALEGNEPDTALSLYKGAFLKGLESYEANEFVTWLEVERELLHGQWRGLVLKKARTLQTRQGVDQEVNLLQRLLATDEFDEEALFALMQVLHANGASKEAVKSYQTFAERLERDMGLTPSSATQQFAKTLEGLAVLQPLPALTVSETKLSLPTPTTSFVGRDLELAAIANLVAEKGCRLLTVFGPGGVGKTRLALQAAHELAGRYQDGAHFVPLEATTSAQAVPFAVAEVLTISLQGQHAPLPQVIEGLKAKQLLLVLDNFEHLIDEVTVVAELLRACPGLDMVVTSRERLNLAEEYVFSLEGLAVPKTEVSLEEARGFDAVALFTERAKRVRSGFTLTQSELPAVLNICRLVQGFPLGIELATVWMRLMSPREIAEEIAKSLDFLESSSRGVSERHRSIRATFDYSWKLLTTREQETLRNLSVFLGGFTREAATFVAGANIALLAALVDKSLLRVLEGRYDFHPLLYQYVGERLSELRGEERRMKAKHLHYFLTLVEASSKTGLQRRIQCCKDEYENLLKALAWSQESDEALMGLRLGNALALFWETQGYISEGKGWLTTILSHPGATEPTKARAEVLLAAADHALSQAEYEVAQAYLEEALTISQSLNLEETAARAFSLLSFIAGQRGDPDRAQRYAGEALTLARKLEDDELVARALVHLAEAAAGHHDYDETLRLTEESILLFRRLGLQFQVVSLLNNLGFWRWLLGDLQAAKSYLEEAVAMAQALPKLTTLCAARSNLGGVMLDLGEVASARLLASEALEFRHKQNDRWGLAYSLENFASLAVVQGDVRRAARLWGAAERLRQEIGSPMPPLWQARYERFVAVAKRHLDEVSFSASWREGQRMGLDEAVSYALDIRD